METGKYIVVSTTKATGQSSMSGKPKPHSTEASAKAEAARLAQENPDRDFSVLKVVATASVAKVTWR
jgi:hypothetical protein